MDNFDKENIMSYFKSPITTTNITKANNANEVDLIHKDNTEQNVNLPLIQNNEQLIHSKYQNNNYKIIEKKSKVFYFSKYTIDTNEIFEIAKAIKTIKENLFRTLLDAMKYSTSDTTGN